MAVPGGTLQARPRKNRTRLFIGGSPQYHVAAPALVARVRMHHHQVKPFLYAHHKHGESSSSPKPVLMCTVCMLCGHAMLGLEHNRHGHEH